MHNRDYKLKKLIIFGGSDFAIMVAKYFQQNTAYQLNAFTVDDNYIASRKIMGVPVIPYSDFLATKPASEYEVFLALGYRNMRARKILFERIKNAGYSFANYIDSSLDENELSSLGENNLILKNVTIEPSISIGNNNIIWSGALICHDSIIGDHNFIASGSILGGGTKVDDGCFLGFRSTVIQNIHIKDECLVGACGLITNDTERFGKYIGIPAKRVSLHEKTGILIN